MKKINRADLTAASEKYKNWGKWGPDDEIGTLNFTSPEDIVSAAQLVRKGKVISLALNFDSNGPQGAKTKYPSMGRINPVHTMLRTGTDAYAGVLDKRGIRAADDMVVHNQVQFLPKLQPPSLLKSFGYTKVEKSPCAMVQDASGNSLNELHPET